MKESPDLGYNLESTGRDFTMRRRESEISFADHGSFEIVSGCCAHRFPPHFHRSDCLVLITDGQAEVTINAKGQSLGPGEGTFIPRFTLHTLSPATSAPYAYLTLCLKNKTGSDEYKAGELSLPIHGLYREFSSETTETQGPDCGLGDYDYLRKAARFIGSLKGLFQLDTLCDHCHVSKYHLIRQFKKRFNLTPYQYYNNLRIGEIRRGLLAEQSPPDLAYALGFSDQSHMCHTFKKYMAVTPLQYKNSYCFHSSAGEKIARM